ncbi:MAG: hypothetical protein H3C26_07355 [Rhodocyclaceae bacterium]|nr:hypothetical protein [Rhodocyclaceae bacterium]
MSFALRELQGLIARRADTSGVVVAVLDGAVRVATRTGAVTVPAGAERLSVGDRVTLADGRALRAPVARASYPV